MHCSEFIRAVPCLTLPAMGQHLHSVMQMPRKAQVRTKAPHTNPKADTGKTLSLQIRPAGSITRLISHHLARDGLKHIGQA